MPPGLPDVLRGEVPPTPSEWALEAQGIRKSFRLSRTNKYDALRGVDLQIPQGQFAALVGPSGSGKSTLLNLLGTLDRPTRGKIVIDGVDTSRLDDNMLAELRNRKIGFVFQSYSLVGRMSAVENVELPLIPRGVSVERRKKRARDMLVRVGLGHRLRNRPVELSGGEQQRVAIARALVNRPRILLTDEPTGALDTKTSADVMRLLHDLNRSLRVTVVLVTHDLHLAAETDRVIRLRDGAIEGEGIPPPSAGPPGVAA